MQLFLRDGPDDVAHVAVALKLSPEEVDQISRLTTEKGSHAQAYLINGERGRGSITIRLGSHIYWLATSDPVTDVPLRELPPRRGRLPRRRRRTHRLGSRVPRARPARRSELARVKRRVAPSG